MARLTANVRVRGIFALVIAVFAALTVLCTCTPAAHAAEAVTRSIGGLNYTLPSDWEGEQVPADLLGEIELTDAVVYTKGDGVFLAVHIADPGVGLVELADFEYAAEEVAVLLNEAELGEFIQVGTAEEQGCPALTFYSDDMSFNDVAYALTVKVYGVNDDANADAVIMASFLPASGMVNEGVLDTLPYYDEALVFEFPSGVSYELPAGVYAADGNVFNIEFFLAYGEDGLALGVDLPMLANDGTITAEAFQEVADMLLEELEFQLGVAAGGLDEIGLDGLWMGGYDFLGFPTFGFELSFDDGVDSVYICATGNVTPLGLAALALLDFNGSGFASHVINSAAALVDPYFEQAEVLVETVPGDVESSASALEDEPGFVVGVVQ